MEAAPKAENASIPGVGGETSLQNDLKMSEQDASSNEGSQASPAEPDVDAIKMFVGQIPRSWNEPECRKMFEKYGPVYSLNILRDKQTQQSKGCCFVTYYHRKDAIGAQCALHNVETIEGMHHAVQMKPADTENRNERKLFIGQLSKKQSEEDVRQMFHRFGHIEDVSVLRDSEGRSRGCAFVTFTTRTCAVNATKEMHHSQTMEGCTAPLVVKFADAQKERDHRQGAKGGPTPLMANPIATPGMPMLGQLAAQPGLNMQALGSLLQLLQPGQQNMLAALGNVLSTLGKISGGEAGQTGQNVAGGGGQSAQQLTQQIAALLQAQGHDSLAIQQQLAMAQQQQQQQHQAVGDYGGYGYQASYGKKAVSPVDQYLQQYALAMPGQGSTPAVGNGDTKGPDGSNLFIYHLPQDFGDSDLLSTFSPFGAVLSAKVFIDKVTNLSKCFGFISYDNALSAQNAINAMNGFQIGSKRLKVQLKNEKTHPYAKA